MAGMFNSALAFALNPPEPLYQLTDGNHPNAEGQRVMFEQVKAANIPAALGK